jgi:Tfp pilus assembly protein PilN
LTHDPDQPTAAPRGKAQGGAAAVRHPGRPDRRPGGPDRVRGAHVLRQPDREPDRAQPVQIDEIKKLKEQTAALLARKRVVESLQTNRTETVRLLDQLVRQLPDGVYLKSVKQKGQVVDVVGYASSNARVSTLMRNFEASPWLESPALIEIKASKVGNNKDAMVLNEFTMQVKITRPKEVAPAARPAAAPATSASAPAQKS